MAKGVSGMNKAQIVGRVARDTKMTKVRIALVVDRFLDEVTRALKKGDRASLVGFGTFTVTRRRARRGRNPQTGSPITIPARRVVRFTSGKTLRVEVR
jgi:DNA-binding protein HU-beta